jgi:hypothetical protein
VTDDPHFFVGGHCWVCGRPMVFDPSRVPSMPLDEHDQPAQSPEEIARREPLCRTCVLSANPAREAAGLPTWDDDESIWEPVRGLPE